MNSNATSASSTPDMVALLQQARQASYQMATLTTAQKNEALQVLADEMLNQTEALLAANAQDMAAVDAAMSKAMADRLKLSPSKLSQLATGMLDLVALPDPVGRVLKKTKLDEGLILEQLTVPLGVIAIVFESRPDAVPQILSLILKSGNAVVFKGGSEAHHSNHAFMRVVEAMQRRCPFLPQGWAQLVDTRQAFQSLLAYPQYVDLVIPRGSNALVQQVMANTKIPVLGHADGVCHLYLHASADRQQALPIIMDSKCQYPAACNALETLLVDKQVAASFLPALARGATEAGVSLKGCEQSRKIVNTMEVATDEDWHTEYGDLTLSVKVVDGLEKAIEHVNTYGSHHTDGIIAQDKAAIEQFMAGVDSASVFANASTRFADGFRFGFGAEIGISTSKTHARGPVGLEGLVIYKYRLQGQGHVVEDYVGDHAKAFLHQRMT